MAKVYLLSPKKKRVGICNGWSGTQKPYIQGWSTRITRMEELVITTIRTKHLFIVKRCRVAHGLKQELRNRKWVMTQRCNCNPNMSCSEHKEDDM